MQESGGTVTRGALPRLRGRGEQRRQKRGNQGTLTVLIRRKNQQELVPTVGLASEARSTTPAPNSTASASRSGSTLQPGGFPQRETPISLFRESRRSCLVAEAATRPAVARVGWEAGRAHWATILLLQNDYRTLETRCRLPWRASIRQTIPARIYRQRCRLETVVVRPNAAPWL